ncbi:MAG: hypothetical protein ACRD21_12550, partial [Vicinamibacteria bacterium]
AKHREDGGQTWSVARSAFAISRASVIADAGSPVAAPRMRLAGRRAHDAAAIPRSTSGTHW